MSFSWYRTRKAAQMIPEATNSALAVTIQLAPKTPPHACARISPFKVIRMIPGAVKNTSVAKVKKFRP